MKENISSADSCNGHARSSPSAKAPRQLPPSFPIVGVGASAGGLEALEQFLGNVSEQSGMAFVVIQHLDPTHQGILPELLQRITKMAVIQASDLVKITPNCVYVIPPNKDISLSHGALHLCEPAAPRGLRLPIDYFFCSLAEEMGTAAIGVILSGMGSDGTIGLRAIRANGGIGAVQEPSTAKFDSMPRSVIDGGLATIVATAGELPGKIIDSVNLPRIEQKSELPEEGKDQSSLEKVLNLLRSKTGHDFSQYKKNTVYRRVERRMGIHQIDTIGSYVRYLEENSQEMELLFKELLIGVTHFFRDPEAWQELSEKAIPSLLAGYPAGKNLRAWSAGCSTGEEAYSLAISFKEVLEQTDSGQIYSLQIFATDLDQDAIDRARQGIYPTSIAAHVSPDRLRRFFVEEENGFRIGKEIREMVTFATQNMIMHPPFTRLDILICRNLLIYLTPELQKKVMPLFHYSLNKNGILLLGSSESVSSFTDLFMAEDGKLRLFRKRDTQFPPEQLAFPVKFTPVHPGVAKELPMGEPGTNLQSLADHLLLQHYAPPAVLTTDKGDIIYISGRTGKYLEPAAGKANWNIFAMAREELRFDLGSAFHKALRQQERVTVKCLLSSEDKRRPSVEITVQLIQKPDALRGMVMVVFAEGTTLDDKVSTRLTASIGKNRILELEAELCQFREALQGTREETQISQEELTSANEELQSTNEELQSTNEELTTSREEMQSLNEELQTVNAEQQSKMGDLARANNDMRNLLNSTEIVTVFLDNNLSIRRFTTGADKLFKLIPGDVGRPLSDIASNLLYPEMNVEIREVLRSLVFSEKHITTTDGCWFSVRIMPYRTMDVVIAGVVITFSNITAAKKLEEKLRSENEHLKKQMNELLAKK